MPKPFLHVGDVFLLILLMLGLLLMMILLLILCLFFDDFVQGLLKDGVMKYLVSNFFDVDKRSLKFVRPIVFAKNFFSRRNIEMERNGRLQRKKRLALAVTMI